MLVVEPPTARKVPKAAPPVLHVVKGAFAYANLLLEQPQSSEFARHKMPVESRMEAFSFWLVCRMRKNLPLVGPELDVHLHEISGAVLEFHKLEPEAPVLSMAHESLKTAVKEAVFEVDGERFNAKFDALVRKWREQHPSLARHKDVYQLSAEYLSAKAADKIVNRLSPVLDALVESAIAEQAVMVA